METAAMLRTLLHFNIHAAPQTVTTPVRPMSVIPSLLPFSRAIRIRVHQPARHHLRYLVKDPRAPVDLNHLP